MYQGGYAAPRQCIERELSICSLSLARVLGIEQFNLLVTVAHAPEREEREKRGNLYTGTAPSVPRFLPRYQRTDPLSPTDLEGINRSCLEIQPGVHRPDDIESVM
jgi:hypothetical protein